MKSKRRQGQRKKAAGNSELPQLIDTSFTTTGCGDRQPSPLRMGKHKRFVKSFGANSAKKVQDFCLRAEAAERVEGKADSGVRACAKTRSSRRSRTHPKSGSSSCSDGIEANEWHLSVASSNRDTLRVCLRSVRTEICSPFHPAAALPNGMRPTKRLICGG